MTMDPRARLERARLGLRDLRVALQSPARDESRMEGLAAAVEADLRGAVDDLSSPGAARPEGLRAQLAPLFTELRGAAALADRGCRLYDGWLQVLCLCRSGYTAEGEPAAAGMAGHLDVKG